MSTEPDFFIDPKNQEAIDALDYRFFECGLAQFMDYSNYEEIKDKKFHELKDQLDLAYDELEKYLKQKLRNNKN